MIKKCFCCFSACFRSLVTRLSHRELWFDQHLEQRIMRQLRVLMPRVTRLECRHAVEEPQQEWLCVPCRLDVLVPQLTQEPAIAKIDGTVNDTQVRQCIVTHVSVDVINHFAVSHVGNADERAYHQKMTVSVAVMPHLRIGFLVMRNLTLPVGRVAVRQSRTGLVHEVPI